MKKQALFMCATAILMMLSGCNYNHYDRNSPYRGNVDFQHSDESVVRPKKMKTMTVSRDVTTTEGGTVHTRTITESVTVPEDVSDADDYKKAQRTIDAGDNYLEIDVNKTYRVK